MVSPSCATFCESLWSFISLKTTLLKGFYLLLSVQPRKVSLFGCDTFFNKGVEEYSLVKQKC